MNDNKFLSTYNHLNDLVDKCIKEHKDHKYPDGIICDTRYIAEIACKDHKNVLRDVEELILNLNYEGRRVFREVAKTGLTTKNQGERIQVAKSEESSSEELAKFEPYAKIIQRKNKESSKEENIDIKHEFRIIEISYYGNRGTIQKAYQLSPVAFLVLMGRYNDTIVYCLSNFFFRVMREIELSIDKLLNTNLDAVDEASELAYQRDSNDPRMRELFRENLPRYLALFGNQKNVVELMTGVQDINKNGFCYATSLDVWKITGKTEHNKVTRDIKHMIVKLRQDGFDIDAHFAEGYRKMETGRTVKVFEMDEIGFLTIMGKYYSWVLYDLAKFYISMKDNIEISGEGLLRIRKEILLEAYEVMKDIAIIKNEEQDRVNRNLFTDIDYPNMSDEEIAKETERIYKHNIERIKKLKDSLKQKYDNKDILN